MKAGTLLIIVLAVVALCVFLAAQPSCEDKGGRSVRDGTRVQLVGKVVVHTAAYRCEMP